MSVVLQANALTTLSAVLEELGLTVGDKARDNRLRRLINEASDFVVGYCGREFHCAAVVERRAGHGQTDLVLRRRPVRSVTAVVEDDVAVTDYVLRDIVVGVPGVLFRDAGWTWFVASVPGILQPPMPGTEDERIVVTYEGGFVTPAQVDAGTFSPRTLPFDLEGVVIRLAASRYLSTGVDPRVKAESVMSASITYIDGALAPDIAVVLDRYKRKAAA